jgi:hypothetical protein
MEEKKSIVLAVLQNTPLAVMVVGLFLIVLGAASGWHDQGLDITDSRWRVALGAIGVITAGAGFLLYYHRPVSEKPDPKKYGIRITSPQTNETVPNRINVRGTYEKKSSLDEFEVRVIEFTLVSQKHYPKRRVAFDEKLKTWETFDFAIDGGRNNDKRIIMVSLLGKSGQALCEYYDRAGEEHRQHHAGIQKLTPDIVECDRITVNILPKNN